MTSGITAKRARNILLNEERRIKESTTTTTMNSIDRFTVLRPLEKRTSSRKVEKVIRKVDN